MKRYIVTAIALLVFCTAHSQVQFYLGIRGGGGEMLTRDQLSNLPTTDGLVNAVRTDRAWTLHAKGEALLGIGRLRIGYQFLYNFSAPTMTSVSYTPSIDDSRFTTYFSNSQVHFFGHYFLTEYAIINLPHFALTPGVALGSYTGFKVDNGSGEKVDLSVDTHHRFSVGAELNAEIKFGRGVFLFGPNYYMFSMQDKANPNWREYQHFIGADAGFRVNLIKPQAR